MLPSRVNGGVRYTYPSFDLVSFAIKDAHDPSIVPAPIPFAPPVTFVAPIFCSYTAAQIDGHVVNLAVQTISGTVE